jgi:hypothetical protein
VGRGAAEFVDLIGPDSVRSFVGDVPESQALGQVHARESAQVRTLRDMPAQRRAILLKTIEEQFSDAVEISENAEGDPEGVPVIRVTAGFDSAYGSRRSGRGATGPRLG